MTVPALAIGEMLVRRHRLGLGIVAAGMSVLALTTTVSPELSANVMGFAFVLFGLGVCYVVAVFAYGFDTDVAAAGSCFPARMLSLPVRTAELAAWPTAFGVVALSVLWLAAAGLVFRPWGLRTPLGWPTAVAATQFVWLLALLWWPFGLPWARIVVGLFIGHLPASVTIYAFQTGVSLADLLLVLGLLSAVGCGTIYLGVWRTRQGLFHRWERVGRSTGEVVTQPFRGRGQAQRWYEWRRHGFVLPLLIALVLPLYLVAFFVDDHNPAKLLRNVLLVLAQPVFFAGMGGTVVGKHNPWGRNTHGIPSFTATRPLTTAAMISAILRTAARTTLITWAVAVGLSALAILLSGAAEPLGKLIRDWAATRSAVEVIATVVTAGALLLLLTWKRLVENLLVGLTGREWLIGGSIFVTLFVAFNAVMLGLWLLVRPDLHGRVRDWLPWVMAVVVGLKLLTTLFVVREIRNRRLLTDRSLTSLTVLWLVVAGGLSAALIWLVPAEIASAATLVLAAILVTPSARISAMPLALDWNRHR